MASIASWGWSTGASTNLRCFSPTMRCCTITKSPSKQGSGNSCPQGPLSRNSSAVCMLSCWLSRLPSVTSLAWRSSALNDLATCCSKACWNSASLPSSRLRPAAMAWPPNLVIKPGFWVATESRASRICSPGMDRDEPFSSPLSPRAKAITGR